MKMPIDKDSIGISLTHGLAKFGIYLYPIKKMLRTPVLQPGEKSNCKA
jgi:hypothetical protein